jgi:predicted dehydrogenase
MSATGDRKRVAVVGAGLISQAMHLPHLALLRDRFELVAVADPSRSVRERVGDRFSIPVRVASAAEAIAHPGSTRWSLHRRTRPTRAPCSMR